MWRWTQAPSSEATQGGGRGCGRGGQKERHIGQVGRLRKLLELYPQQAGLPAGLEQVLNLPGLSFPSARCCRCKALQTQVVTGLAHS